MKFLCLVILLSACQEAPVALPVTDADNIKTMSDATLAAYKETCDLKTEYLMSQGNEVEARYWAYTRLTIVSEQQRRKR